MERYYEKNKYIFSNNNNNYDNTFRKYICKNKL